MANKICKIYFIYNPSSKRCVKINGKIGRSIIASATVVHKASTAPATVVPKASTAPAKVVPKAPKAPAKVVPKALHKGLILVKN